MAQAKKRKRFFDVEIPLINKETQIYAYEIEEAVGKSMKYDLTRFLRGKSMILKLKIDIKDGKLIALPIEATVLPYFIRRMMRKGTNYVEDSFSVKAKDANIRLKPFLITRKKVSRVVRGALRTKAKEELTDYVKDKTVETLFDDLIKNKIQKHLSLVLKKVYPLSLCEIRIFKIEKNSESKE